MLASLAAAAEHEIKSRIFEPGKEDRTHETANTKRAVMIPHGDRNGHNQQWVMREMGLLLPERKGSA